MLACVQRDPCPLDTVVAALRVPLLDAAMAVARLERTGWVREAGGWFEAVGPWGVEP